MSEWSNACEDAWLTAHQYANEKNCAGVLAALLTLLVAFQYDNKGTSENVVKQIHLKLRSYDSPIYLLAKKPTQRNECFYLPSVQNNEIVFKQVKNQLFVQIETFAQHDRLVKQEWSGIDSHLCALDEAGFSL